MRMWAWFMPMMPPSMAFRILVANSMLVISEVEKNVSAASGASFCQVDKYRAGIHDKAVIADGYQKWHGAAPILRRSDIISSPSMCKE